MHFRGFHLRFRRLVLTVPWVDVNGLKTAMNVNVGNSRIFCVGQKKKVEQVPVVMDSNGICVKVVMDSNGIDVKQCIGTMPSTFFEDLLVGCCAWCLVFCDRQHQRVPNGTTCRSERNTCLSSSAAGMFFKKSNIFPMPHEVYILILHFMGVLKIGIASIMKHRALQGINEHHG